MAVIRLFEKIGFERLYVNVSRDDASSHGREGCSIQDDRDEQRSLALTLGPSIKYVKLFLANFDPPPLCHTLSHIPGPPESTSHISDPPPISSRPSTKIP